MDLRPELGFSGLIWAILLQAIWPESKQNGPDPSIMAQIQVIWPKYDQNLGIGGHNRGLSSQNDGPQARIGVLWLDLSHFAGIWAIMLDLVHIA